MITYRLDEDGGITAYSTRKEAIDALEVEGLCVFATEADLREHAEKTIPMKVLVDAWNSLPGVTAVTKFKDRASAAVRIWRVVEKAFAPEAAAPKQEAKQVDATPPPPTREGSKKAQALEMLREGTTREALQTAFGWQPHTTRGFLSILGKSHSIEVTKGEGGVRHYRIAS